MRHYKMLNDGYLVAIGTGAGGEEITKAEYMNLYGIILSRPEAPEGYVCRLTAEGEWELYKNPDEGEKEETKGEEGA